MAERWKYERREREKKNAKKKKEIQIRRATDKKIAKAETRRHTLPARLRRIYGWGATGS